MTQIVRIANSMSPNQAGLYFNLDFDGRLLQWNIEFERTTGKVPGELAGKKIIELLVDKDRKKAEQVIAEGFRQGLVDFSARLLTCGGAVKHKFKILVNLDDDGRYRGMTGVAQPEKFKASFVERRKMAQPGSLEQRLKEQQTALHHLANQDHFAENDMGALFHFTTETVARTLGVERVSVWLFDETHSKLSCVDLYEYSSHKHSQDLALLVKSYPVYFQALEENRCISATDAHKDPRLSEFTESYLQPLNIFSRLDTPLRICGKVIGVISYEYTNDNRIWHLDEESFAAAIADHVALLIEVFEHREAKVVLEKTSAEWEVALNAVDDTLFIVDLDDRLLRANKNFYEATQLDPCAINHQDISRFLHPESWVSTADITPGALNHREVTVFMDVDDPYNFIGAPVELEVRVIRDDNDKPNAVLYYFRDLTRIREAEDSYHKLHEHINVLLDSTREGIIGVDMQMCCTFLNRAATDILGYDSEDLHCQDIYELIHHSNEQGFQIERDKSRIFRSIKEQRGFHINKENFCTKKGYCIQVEYSVNPMYEKGKINGAVVVFRNISDALAMESQMDYIATHDTLTGLVNRYEFEQILSQALATAKQYKDEHVLCYMDLDQFKIINDTCGHITGDELLKELTQLLKQDLRQDDVLARLGGDEFGLLLNNCNPQQAQRVLEKLQKVIKAFRFIRDGKQMTVGVSIGVVAITEQSQDTATILSLADSACFLAKEEGRNRIHLYHKHDEDLAQRHGEMQWVSRIHNALENDRLQLYCQPIEAINLRNQDHKHIEILLRMVDEQGLIISPETFIPAAERYNLMSDIDRWVIKNTFGWMHRNADVTQNLMCSINLSGQSLGDEGFLEYLITELMSHKIRPESVCFEITETAAIANLSRAILFIKELRQLGCSFSLDDFGSGMSSFTYLKNLPVDFLKIDGNLVKDIATDVINFSMVEAINRVGFVMGIRTIAEYVENDLILEKLEQIGVDYAQGYGIARPKPLDAATL
ncbi:MAG: EAL domain-containing protein [Gammaproteobacteria bacterium]|nr:EAL domain-containing protein [Gammaproteobacteria bacterium]